jgi:hypothetical protein
MEKIEKEKGKSGLEDTGREKKMRRHQAEQTSPLLART